MSRPRSLYRIVCYKKKNKDKLELHNIAYSKLLSYGLETTGISPTDPLGSYMLKVDKSLGMLDKDQKLLFENDLVENDKKQQYVIEWCQEKLGFVLRNSNPDDTLESLDITSQRWKLIGNKYKDVKKFNKIMGDKNDSCI